MAAAVLLVAETGRSVAETNIDKQRVATELREAMLTQELALDQAMAGLGVERLAVVVSSRRDLEDALTRARDFADDAGRELQLVDGQAAAYAEYRRRADDEVADVRAGTTEGAAPDDDRLAPFERFFTVSDEYRMGLEAARRADARRASLTAVLAIVGLSALFLLAGAMLVRRDRAARADAEAGEAAERTAEERFQTSQRRLAEALQVAAGQREAHSLVKHHLELAMPGTEVHIFNRNNSADRLEASTPLPDASPLVEPLTASEPRSCIAVRLSREFERGPSAQEVLECDICGKLDGESVCRPLLVGGEVIGAVLVESPATLAQIGRRRVEESVNSAAPVLANLRNLAIAEIRAATDALTGLPNRRSVDDTVKRMVAQASRAVTPLAVLQFDLDHFKEVNDRFGHERGDAVLAGFGALLRSQMRASDFAGRSGGEEFLVLLPDTDRAGALQLAEKLRRAAGTLQVDGVDRRITTSIGLAVYPDDASDELALLRRADRALYAAKQGGRDRVEMVSAAGSPAHESV